MKNQPTFLEFCKQLEGLKDSVPLYKPSDEWVEKMMTIIRDTDQRDLR